MHRADRKNQMRVIILTRGEHTIVDDDVFEWASNLNWHVVKHPRKIYATRNVQLQDGTRIKRLLHRDILGATGKIEVDHIDGDGLNNLRGNLRVCTRAGNNQNRKLADSSVSGFKGVSFNKPLGKWQARIMHGTASIWLGLFEDASEAARAYDNKAVELFGEFAWLNFKRQTHNICAA